MILFRKHLSWLAVGLGVLASGLAYRSIHDSERAAEQAEFVRHSEVLANVIGRSLRDHEEALYSLRNLYAFSTDVTRQEFDGAAADLLSRHSAILALEWAERVPGAARAAVEAAVRAEGFPGFQFTERDRGPVLRRAADRPEHVPVLFIHPYVGNKAALGFDLASGVTWADLQRVAASNGLHSSGRLPLITDGHTMDWGYILGLPIYRAPVPEAPAARLAARGFVLGVFRVADLVESAIQRISPQGMDVLVVDPQGRPGQQLLHFHSSRLRHVPVAATTAADLRGEEFAHSLPVAFGGRTWELRFRPAPEWLEHQRTSEAFAVLTGGLLSSLLLGLVLRAQQRRTSSVEQQVAVRTAELQATQAQLKEDVAQREDAERRLQENRRQLATLIRQLPGAAFRCKPDANLTTEFISEGILALTGYTPEEFLSGQIHIASLTVPADRAAWRAAVDDAVQKRRPFEVEYRIRHRSGQERWVLVRGQPIHTEDGPLRILEGLAIDVTALKQAEAEKISIERKMLETQKLESLGVLAGGIAHDFNNILTSVLANATLARDEAGSGRSIDPNLQQIEHAARRAADLCQQMLAYAGKGKIVSDRVDLSELVRGTATLLDVSISKNTRLALHLAESLPPVLADITQIRQIVMNLVINAADAIADQPGLITIATFAREADAALLRGALGSPELPPGAYVGLEVTDNGSGMTPDTIARIFEPFFTTKFSGRGLGLSAVLGIVQSHHGALFVESTLGRGSLFRLLLPATAGPAVAVASTPSVPADRARLHGTVLIVDDDDSVRKVAETVLKMNGAVTLTAANGEAAIELLGAQAGRISVVLLDMTMPGISGEETLRRMRLLHHPHPVILMSGYSQGESLQHSAQLGVSGFLQKPFEIETLLAKVKPFLA